MFIQSNASQTSAHENGLWGRAFFVLLTLLLVARIGLFMAAQPWDPVVQETGIIIKDSVGYHEYALRIMEGRSLGDLGVFRTPGYPLIIAATYSVFGVKPWLVLLLQIAASAVTLTLLYHLACGWFGRNAAIVAGALYALDPYAIFYANNLLTDTFFAMVFLGSVVVFLRALNTRNSWTFFWAGALVGAATLIRPISQFLPVVYIVLCFLFLRRTRLTALRSGVVLLLAYLIVLAPWLYRNYHEYGYAQLTSISGDTLLKWAVPYTESALTGKDITEVRQEFTEIARQHGLDGTSNPFERSNIKTTVAAKYIKQHPIEYAAASLKGAFFSLINLNTQGYANLLRLQSTTLSFKQYGGESQLAKVLTFIQEKSVGELIIGSVTMVFLSVTYLLSFVGMLRLLKNRDYWPIIVVGAMIAYFLLFVGPMGIARYKLPFIPLYLSIAGFGFSQIVSACVSRRKT